MCIIDRHTKDRLNYQGLAYDFIGFDELTHFTWEEYSYMFSRNRPSEPGTRVYLSLIHISTNNCKLYVFNHVDAFYENADGYRPRKPLKPIGDELSLIHI